MARGRHVKRACQIDLVRQALLFMTPGGMRRKEIASPAVHANNARPAVKCVSCSRSMCRLRSRMPGSHDDVRANLGACSILFSSRTALAGDT